MKKDSLKVQIICFCVTLVLLFISVFVFKNVMHSDRILMVLAVLELIGIVLTLMKRKKDKLVFRKKSKTNSQRGR